ncbi:hypothetical protein ACFL96_02600 [Thermoproteota archaeon]
MKKIIACLVVAGLLGFASNAFAFIEVPSYGETGWQTFSHTFEESWSGFIGVAVSNFGDEDVDSALLIDNFNIDILGNEGFELNNPTGYITLGSANIVPSFTSYNGNTYLPTEGSLMGQLWSNGAYVAIAQQLSFAAGETFAFDWAFLAFDYAPYRDFAFLMHSDFST